MPRPSGSPNKNKQALINLLQDKYPDYQPVIAMAEHAHECDKLVNEAVERNVAARNGDEDVTPVPVGTILEMRVAATEQHNKVAKYVTPQLKAIEMTGDSGITLVVKDLSGA